MSSTRSIADAPARSASTAAQPDRRGAHERELRDFGLIVGGLFAAIFGLLLPILHRRAIPLWPWALAAILATIAMARPALLEYVYKGWSALGAILGWVNTRIVLTLLFYAVITPMGLIGRTFGLVSIKAVGGKGEPSYRVPSRQVNKSSFERPF